MTEHKPTQENFFQEINEIIDLMEQATTPLKLIEISRNKNKICPVDNYGVNIVNQLQSTKNYNEEKFSRLFHFFLRRAEERDFVVEKEPYFANTFVRITKRELLEELDRQGKVIRYIEEDPEVIYKRTKAYLKDQ